VLVSHEMVTHVGDFLDASLRWNDGRDWVDLGSGVGMTGGCAGWVRWAIGAWCRGWDDKT